MIQKIYLIVLFTILASLSVQVFTMSEEQVAKNEEIENRKYTSWPSFGPNWKAMFTKIDSYVADRFTFRLSFLRFYSGMSAKLFEKSYSEKDVVIGKDGWIFSNSQNDADLVMGLRKIPQEDYQKAAHLLTERADWLALHGVKFYLMVTPRKHRIYPDKLPERYRGYKEDLEFPNFLNELAKHPNITLISIEEEMKAQHDDEIYYKTDTHWNPKGAYIGYKKTIEVLQNDGVDVLSAIPYDESRFTYRKGNTPGDLGMLLQAPQFGSKTIKDIDEYDKSTTTKVEMSPTWKGLNHLQPPLRFENPQGKVRMLLQRDSFSELYIPYMKENFKESLCLWTPDFYPGIVLEYQPDIYVYEIFERIFFFNLLEYGNPAYLAKDLEKHRKEPL